MTNVIYISEDEAEDIMYGKAGKEVGCDHYSGSKHRWWTEEYYVFPRDGKLYEFLYMEPSTEEQDGQDVWEEEPIPCYEVIAAPTTTIVYRRAHALTGEQFLAIAAIVAGVSGGIDADL